MTIRHIVMWKLAAESAAEKQEHAAEIVKRLRSLVGVVPELNLVNVGVETLYPDTNYDVVLVADFASAEALQAYQVHPAHQEVAAYVRSVVSLRAAVDFERDSDAVSS